MSTPDGAYTRYVRQATIVCCVIIIVVGAIPVGVAGELAEVELDVLAGTTGMDGTAAGATRNETNISESEPPGPADINGVPLRRTINGISIQTAMQLWSGDVDDPDAQIKTQFYREVWNRGGGDAIKGARQGDVTRIRPPREAGVWARNAHDSLGTRLRQEGLGTNDWALVLPSSTPVDGQFTKDAHVTLHTVTPQTRLHTARGVRRVVAPNGTVGAVVDYRVEMPSQQVREGGRGDIVRQVTTYEYVNDELAGVELRVGEKVRDEATTHAPQFTYALASYERPDSLTLRARITVTAEKTVRTTRRETYTVRRNGTEVTKTRRVTTTRTKTVTRTQTVKSQYDISVARLPRAEVRRAELPRQAETPRGQQTALGIQVDGLWSGYSLTRAGVATDDPRTDRVSTRWRFYVSERAGWSELRFRSDTGSTAVQTPATFRPVTVHAVRVDTEMKSTPQALSEGPTGVRTTGEERGRPTGVDQTVEISRADQPTESVQTMFARHAGVMTTSDPQVRVFGVVYGISETHDLGTVPTRTLRRTNLTTRIVEHEGSNMTVQVTLRDQQTGDPLRRPPRRAVFGFTAQESFGLREGGDTAAWGRPATRSVAARRVPGAVTIALDTAGMEVDPPRVYVVSGPTLDVSAVPVRDLTDDGTATVTVAGGGGTVYAAFYPRAWTATQPGVPAYLPATAQATTDVIADIEDVLGHLSFWVVLLLPLWVVWKIAMRARSIVRTGLGVDR